MNKMINIIPHLFYQTPFLSPLKLTLYNIAIISAIAIIRTNEKG